MRSHSRLAEAAGSTCHLRSGGRDAVGLCRTCLKDTVANSTSERNGGFEMEGRKDSFGSRRSERNMTVALRHESRSAPEASIMSIMRRGRRLVREREGGKISRRWAQ